MLLAFALRQKPKLLLSTGEGRGAGDDYTLVLCFSRNWCVGPFFQAFNKLRILLDRCHLLIYDNTDNAMLETSLRRKFELYKDVFASVRLYKSYRQGGDKLYGSKDEGFDKSKLPVIYAMHRDICDLIHTDKFVLLEDDTLPPKLAVTKLLHILHTHRNCGIATAIATGRGLLRANPVRLGVHFLTRDRHRILARVTPPPTLSGLVRVDACGWYCCASYTSLWKRSIREMRRYVKSVPRFGLDNIHTNNIKMRGYDIIADFSLWCKHLSLSGGRVLEWTRKHAVPMVDLWIPFYNCYAQGIQVRWSKKFLPKNWRA